MNRLGVKLILSIVSFFAVNIWLIGKGVAKGAADFFTIKKAKIPSMASGAPKMSPTNQL